MRKLHRLVVGALVVGLTLVAPTTARAAAVAVPTLFDPKPFDGTGTVGSSSKTLAHGPRGDFSVAFNAITPAGADVHFPSIQTTPQTRYFRIDPQTGGYLTSTYETTVVVDDTVRVVGEFDRRGVATASVVYNTDPSRAGSRQFIAEFMGLFPGVAVGPGVDGWSFQLDFYCTPGDNADISTDKYDGRWSLADGSGNSIFGSFDTTNTHLWFDSFEGTGIYEGASGSGRIEWESVCTVDYAPVGHLSIAVHPA